jgi:hypothetical protein
VLRAEGHGGQSPGRRNDDGNMCSLFLYFLCPSSSFCLLPVFISSSLMLYVYSPSHILILSIFILFVPTFPFQFIVIFNVKMYLTVCCKCTLLFAANVSYCLLQMYLTVCCNCTLMSAANVPYCLLQVYLTVCCNCTLMFAANVPYCLLQMYLTLCCKCRVLNL